MLAGTLSLKRLGTSHHFAFLFSKGTLTTTEIVIRLHTGLPFQRASPVLAWTFVPSVRCAHASHFDAVQGVEGRAQATEASLTNSRLCPSHAAMHITPAELNARSVLQDGSSGAV